MRRRHFLRYLSGLSALASLPGLAGCAPEETLRVGIHPWIGYETLYLAREFRWLPNTIVLREGSTAGDSIAALQTGLTDAACLTLDETLRVRAIGIPMAIGLVFDTSVGADAVLSRTPLKNPRELAGKRIGVERNAVGALVLNRFAEHAGLSVESLTLVDLPIEQQLDAWREGRVDAVVSYEPTADLLRREGAYDLFDSHQMPDAIFDVLAVRRDCAVAREAALNALVAGHFRALDHLHSHRQDAIYRIAARQGIVPDEVRHALAGITQPSLDANRKYLSTNDGRLVRAAEALSDMLVKIRQLESPDSLGGLIMPDWLPNNT